MNLPETLLIPPLTIKMSGDDLQAKHRRERKELQAKITAMKKGASKNDKKKILEEVGKVRLWVLF